MNDKFFLDLCGQYSLVDEVKFATIWKNKNNQVLWFLRNELSFTTGHKWNVLEIDDSLNVRKIEEPEGARRFRIELTETLENYERIVTVEKEFFDVNIFFNQNKRKYLRMWVAKLFINGVEKRISIVEYNNKFYRVN